MAKAYGVQFSDWILVGAIGAVGYFAYKNFGKTIGSIGSIASTTTADTQKVVANTTHVASSAIIAVENLPGEIIGWIRNKATAAEKTVWNWIT